MAGAGWLDSDEEDVCAEWSPLTHINIWLPNEKVQQEEAEEEEQEQDKEEQDKEEEDTVPGDPGVLHINIRRPYY